MVIAAFSFLNFSFSRASAAVSSKLLKKASLFAVNASEMWNIGVNTVQKKFGATRRTRRIRTAVIRAYAPHEMFAEDSSALRLAKNVLFIDEKIFVQRLVLGHDACATYHGSERIRCDSHRHPEHLRQYLRQTAQKRPPAEDGYAV